MAGKNRRQQTFIRAILFAALVSTPGPRLSALDASNDQAAQFESRRAAVIAEQLRRPFPKTDCSLEFYIDDPCLLGQLNLALATLYADPSAPSAASANELLKQALSRLERPEIAKEFHMVVAGLVFRTLAFFGADGQKSPKLVEPQIEARLKALFWAWASTSCKLADANREDLWRIWRSENHGAQRDAACWEAAYLFRTNAPFNAKKYSDGSDAARQWAAWSAYLERFLAERGRKPVLVEYFSPTYAQYTLSPIYTYFDFAPSPRLKTLARNTLDLWWAIWAAEQTNGSHGGSKTRVYQKTLANGSPMAPSADAYFGFKTTTAGFIPGQAAMLTSTYRPADIIYDLALGARSRPAYTISVRALGLQRVPIADDWYEIIPDRSDLLRIAYVTPDFVMGSAMTAKLAAAQWAAISSQNRWSGVVFSDDPEARIAIYPEALGLPSSNNSMICVQSKATLIAQRLATPYSASTGAMRVWIGRPLRRVERDGWLFLAGAGYAAVRPASGGYTWNAEEPRFLMPNDSSAPVIVQAAELSSFSNFEAFQDAILKRKFDLSEDHVTFDGLDGAGRVTLFTNSDRVSEIDGEPVDLAPPDAIKSPFINAGWNAPEVEINFGGKSLRLDFR